MCLTNPDPEPTRKYGVGYKSVRRRANGQYECYDHCLHAGSVVYPLNKWVTDPNTGDASLGTLDSKPYPVGFHIMLKRLKIGGLIIKVKFRQVVATQTENIDNFYGPQVVARQVMNLGEVSV